MAWRGACWNKQATGRLGMLLRCASQLLMQGCKPTGSLGTANHATLGPVCTCLQEEVLLRSQLKVQQMECNALAKPGLTHRLSFKPCCTATGPSVIS